MTRLFASLLIALTTSGCGLLYGRDTCSGGHTFSDPHFDDDAQVSAETVVVTFAWAGGTGPAADLPESYYEAMSVRVSYEASTQLRAGEDLSVEYLGNHRAALTLPPLGEESERDWELVVSEPDRNSYLDCEHPGQEDEYRLNISFTVGSDGELIRPRFANDVYYGNL